MEEAKENNPNEYSLALLKAVCNRDIETKVRTMAAVLLRRVVIKNDLDEDTVWI